MILHSLKLCPDASASGHPEAVLEEYTKPPGGDICRNFHGGNPESEAANAATSKARDRARVLDFISRLGLSGTTCDNLEAQLGLRHQTASARCSELLNEGVIVRKPLATDPLNPLKYEKRPTRSGSNAAVLVMATLVLREERQQTFAWSEQAEAK